MGLAAAEGSLQHQPAFQAAGILLGVVKSPFQGVCLSRAESDLAPYLEVFKGQMRQFFEIAKLVEAAASMLPQLPFPAGTDLDLAKILMAYRQFLP